jgi:hypothetical protein
MCYHRCGRRNLNNRRKIIGGRDGDNAEMQRLIQIQLLSALEEVMRKRKR